MQYSRLEVIDDGKKTIGFVKSQQLSSVVPFKHERINQRDEQLVTNHAGNVLIDREQQKKYF